MSYETNAFDSYAPWASNDMTLGTWLFVGGAVTGLCALVGAGIGHHIGESKDLIAVGVAAMREKGALWGAGIGAGTYVGGWVLYGVKSLLEDIF